MKEEIIKICNENDLSYSLTSNEIVPTKIIPQPIPKIINELIKLHIIFFLSFFLKKLLAVFMSAVVLTASVSALLTGCTDPDSEVVDEKEIDINSLNKY